MSKKTNRRAVLAGLAIIPCAPAMALPTSPPDPVFAALERARKAEAAWQARCRCEDAIEDAGGDLELAFGDHRSPEAIALVDEGRAAQACLANVVPTTLVGLAALLAFVVAQSAEYDEFWFEDGQQALDFLRSIERCASTLARAGA